MCTAMQQQNWVCLSIFDLSCHPNCCNHCHSKQQTISLKHVQSISFNTCFVSFTQSSNTITLLQTIIKDRFNALGKPENRIEDIVRTNERGTKLDWSSNVLAAKATTPQAEEMQSTRKQTIQQTSKKERKLREVCHLSDKEEKWELNEGMAKWACGTRAEMRKKKNEINKRKRRKKMRKKTRQNRKDSTLAESVRQSANGSLLLVPVLHSSR